MSFIVAQNTNISLDPKLGRGRLCRCWNVSYQLPIAFQIVSSILLEIDINGTFKHFVLLDWSHQTSQNWVQILKIRKFAAHHLLFFLLVWVCDTCSETTCIGIRGRCQMLTGEAFRVARSARFIFLLNLFDLFGDLCLLRLNDNILRHNRHPAFESFNLTPRPF